MLGADNFWTGSATVRLAPMVRDLAFDMLAVYFFGKDLCTLRSTFARATEIPDHRFVKKLPNRSSQRRCNAIIRMSLLAREPSK